MAYTITADTAVNPNKKRGLYATSNKGTELVGFIRNVWLFDKDQETCYL